MYQSRTSRMGRGGVLWGLGRQCWEGGGSRPSGLEPGRAMGPSDGAPHCHLTQELPVLWGLLGVLFFRVQISRRGGPCSAWVLPQRRPRVLITCRPLSAAHCSPHHGGSRTRSPTSLFSTSTSSLTPDASIHTPAYTTSPLGCLS